MEDLRIAGQVAEWNPQGESRRGTPVSTRKRHRAKRETSRIGNVSIESYGGEKIYIFGLRKTVYLQKNLLNKIIITASVSEHLLFSPIKIAKWNWMCCEAVSWS
jgi:hypothetical protein